MDLGRFDLMLKSKTFWKLVRKGFYPVISSESIRFRRALKFPQAFDLVTKIEAWDDTDVYISQQFIRDGRVVAEGIIKGRFLQRGRRGSVPNEELFELLGIEESSQSLNKKASMQKRMEAELAKVTPATLLK